MSATLEDAIREAKIEAGLLPDKKYPPNLFHEFIPQEWRRAFWERQVDRVIESEGKKMSIFDSTMEIAEDVADNRAKAHAKHGANSIEAVDPSEIGKWLAILGEEFGEVCESLTYDKDSSNLRAELLDLVTVGVAWIAALDRAAVLPPERGE